MSGHERSAPGGDEGLRQRIQLYLYGELGLAERNQMDRWRNEDPEFRALVEEEEAFLLGMAEPDFACDFDALLGACRDRLDRDVALQAAPPGGSSLWARSRSALRRMAARPLVWQPAAAALLLAIGFLAGRSAFGPDPRSAAPMAVDGLLGGYSGDANRTLTGIETVQLDPIGGQVQIVLEERRTVIGDSSDPFIRTMLFDTVQNSHAGARLTSLEALRSQAGDRSVRRALLRSMIEDENPGVRLLALDSLRDHARHAEVRNALVQTLRSDPSTGMRVHAIQLLREHPTRDLAGPLQELVNHESNPFVLEETEQILDALGASRERY